ncbi:hypothetical protein MSC49_40870 (plasmid) [Methylosinus sp. C49]|nr:hypothetical protein MSC49_40870 [Methylosinus sp. C49]
MLAQAIARAFDLEDDGMVQEAVENFGGDSGVTEGVAPFRETAVRGENHRAFLIASVDELEEQIAAAQRYR